MKKALPTDSNESGSSGFRQYPFWPTLWHYVQPYRLQIGLSAVGAVVSGTMVAFQPLIIKFIVDEGISRPDASAHERMVYALAFAGIYILISSGRIIAWSFGYSKLVVALEGFLFSLRSQFFRHIQRLCYRFHDQVSSGELFNYIMGSPINSLKNFLSQFSMSVPNQAVSWVIAFFTLVYFDWLMTLVLLAIVAVIVAVNHRSRGRIRVMTADFMQEESAVSKYVADMLRGTREIKIHAIENEVSNSFDDQIDRIRDKSTRLSQRQQLEYIKPEGLQYLGFGLIYCVGAYSCIYRDMSAGKLFAFVNSIHLLMGPIMMMFHLNLTRANAEAGLERIMRVLDTESTVGEPDPDELVNTDRQHGIARGSGIPFLQFRNVGFGYAGLPVFKDLSCSIRHGESVALVGPSGSGKSTFINLVLRLYDPHSGEILLNGFDIRRYASTDLRSTFGVVSQDPFLFQGSIYENVRVAHPHATREEVMRALELAYVTEFLSDLPEGVESQVGENGYALSGGQRQRIAIARAILGNHNYFIFDEATSALDNTSERRIQQALAHLMADHTVIIIAHRLSTIRNVDKILVFEKGAIVQEGTYDSLSTTSGVFSRLLASGDPPASFNPLPA